MKPTPPKGSPNLKSQKWLTTKQAAEYLGISEKSIRNNALKGQLKRYRMGRKLYFKRQEIDMNLESSAKGVL